MSSTEFKGTYTALATPFNNDGVDYDDLEALVEYQIKGGITGLVALVQLENPYFIHSEHIDVIRQTVQFANTRVPVYAGTGSNSTDEAIELTKEADKAGANGFLLVAPYYNKPSEEGLLAHFSAIAEVTDKPIILYSIPSRCGIEISVDVAAKLYELPTRLLHESC